MLLLDAEQSAGLYLFHRRLLVWLGLAGVFAGEVMLVAHQRTGSSVLFTHHAAEILIGAGLPAFARAAQKPDQIII